MMTELVRPINSDVKPVTIIIFVFWRSQGEQKMLSSKGDKLIITDFWTQWEKKNVGWFERTALKHIDYHM